jgi:UDP-N-acetylmuramyl-tripeptide synthetase/UDP-N-acetylmuramoyl-tripeptide--D-alanyl-D-alanine ligase
MKAAEILAVLQKDGLLIESRNLSGETDIPGEPRTDNRKVRQGDIFICIKGLVTDGHKYIPDVRKKKAALVVCEDDFQDDLPAIRVRDSRKAAALIARLFYHNPSSRFRLIGITGTNGKTTTSMLLFQAMREIGYSCGWIGTLGYGINDRHFDSLRTTPDILELNAILAEMAKEGVEYCFMEVSSHALALDRVYGVEFDFCLFTNLSREHLDFHGNMEDYGATKVRLFDGALERRSIGLINIDDDFGRHLYQDLKERGAYVFSIGSSEADYIIHTDRGAAFPSWDQSRFTLQCHDCSVNIRSPLIGRFNIANLAMSAATLNLLGMEKRQIESGLNNVAPVPGRFERVPNESGIGVFVDYAHTPDALENVLQTGRELGQGRLLCLIGAGGERDRGKRPLMINAALKHADVVIIADDNPRSEDPNAIIREMVAGSDIWLPWWIIRDRKEAIMAILRLARPGDMVLICGKGHEAYQEIEGIKHHFDDTEIAREFLPAESREISSNDLLALPVDRLMIELLLNVPAEASSGYKPPQTFKHISTDSRTIQLHSVFFALKGDSFDGNDYLDQILRERTNLGIGSREMQKDNYLLVPEPLEAMAKLHRKYLLMFDSYKIALTGSTGKSSTKEMLAQVFSSEAPTLKTEANENNIIGLCKTIARIKPEHRFSVFELGTNAFGEISALSDVCSPDAGIIMNIGPSHLEFLEDENGVFREKIALFNRPLDIRLYDADDPRFEHYKNNGRGIGFDEQADFRLTDLVIDEQKCRFKINAEEFEIPYPVGYFAKNAAFAIVMGWLKDIPTAMIRDALKEPVKLHLRLQLEETDNNLLVIDCYNANPVSMQSAIEYWRSLRPEAKHIAILGDMLELGRSAPQYHDMVAAILIEQGYDQLITTGDLAIRYHGKDTTFHDNHFDRVEDLISSGVLDKIEKGAVILVKGSHSVHLEKILPYLRKEM